MTSSRNVKFKFLFGNAIFKNAIKFWKTWNVFIKIKKIIQYEKEKKFPAYLLDNCVFHPFLNNLTALLLYYTK